jgi:hypothetical protein
MLESRYGKLTVLDPAGRYRAHDLVPCLCDCGNERQVPRYRLSQGRTKSCGCYRREVLQGKSWANPLPKSDTEVVPGARFGRWTVLGPVQSGHDRSAPCRCDCGTERAVAARDLRLGKTKSCGCYRRDGARSMHQHF